jgi:hypothetical protein
VANDNKISLELEISDRSVETAWGLVDERGTKSAKSSAVAFESAFAQQEQVLKSAIEKLTNESVNVARKSAKESADVFQQAFEKQSQIYKASVKQNIDQALNALTNPSGVKKSAAESASVFEEAFAKQAKDFEPVPLNIDIPKGSEFNAIQSLADVNAAVLLVQQGLSLLKKGFVEALDVVLAGEKIQKIEGRFAALATQVGIASESFSGKMRDALKGFVDDTDALAFASEAFVKLGNSAKALPEVIIAARKSYQVFGGDILENAGKIINAAETGSSRTLRDIGLYLNLETAVKKYAKAQGTIPALLTDSQKEQARLSAILAAAEDRFAGVQAKAGSISAYTQLKVALKDLEDEFLKIANSKLGQVFQGIAEGATAAIKSISNTLKNSQPADSVEEITKRIEVLRAKQSKYSEELASLGTAANLGYGATLKANLVVLKDQINSYDEVRRKLGQLAASQLQNAKAKAPRDDSADQAILEARRNATAKLSELDKAQQASEIILAQDRVNRARDVANVEDLYNKQKIQQQTNYELEYAALQKTFADNGAFTQDQKNLATETLEQTHLNNMIKLRRDYKDQLNLITNEEALNITSYADGVSAVLAGMREGALFQFTSIKASLKDLGKAFVQTFKQQATNAIFAFAQGTKSASEAAQGLFTGILNAMGEMLISQGLGFIIQGAAYTYAGMPNGPPLAAAGAGMVALGATLAAISAANGGAVGASASGGGSAGVGASTSNGNNNTTTPIVNTKPENPNTQINVNVGQVFDRKETGMWITDILTENFEQNGVIVRSNV